MRWLWRIHFSLYLPLHSRKSPHTAMPIWGNTLSFTRAEAWLGLRDSLVHIPEFQGPCASGNLFTFEWWLSASMFFWNDLPANYAGWLYLFYGVQQKPLRSGKLPFLHTFPEISTIDSIRHFQGRTQVSMLSVAAAKRPRIRQGFLTTKSKDPS